MKGYTGYLSPILLPGLFITPMCSPILPGFDGTGPNNFFDIDRGCNNQGCAVSLNNGNINLAQRIRNVPIPSNNDVQKEFAYYYKMDDTSQKTLNILKVKIYYYTTDADIPL